MRNRPWPLILLALIQILTPVFNILFNAWVLSVSPVYVLSWLMRGPKLEVFEALLLMPIAGIAIFCMRKWSYGVFLGAMAWSMFRNFYAWETSQSTFPVGAILLVYFFEILLVGYFLIPAVRQTYFDPSVRWWESKPRYMIEVPSIMECSNRHNPSTLLNLSEGGALVSAPAQLDVESLLQLSFSVLGKEFRVPGKVAHRRDLGTQEVLYGIQFHHTSESQRPFRDLVQAIRLLGYGDRDQRQTGFGDFKQWVSTLFSTGQGWIPQPKGRAIGKSQ